MSSELFEISVYDLEGNYITSAFGIKAASELTKVSRSSISSCVNGKQNFSGGFQFRKFYKEPLKKIGDVSILYKHVDLRPVAKYFNNNLVCVYESIAEASLKNKLDTSSVFYSCDKGFKSGIYNFNFIEKKLETR